MKSALPSFSMRERLSIGSVCRNSFLTCGDKFMSSVFIRAMYNPRFRRLFLHYENSFFAHLFPDLNFSAPYLCRLLKSLGKQRDAIAAFMREDIDLKRSFILFDGHRLLSASRTMEFAELGYDSKRRFKPQINLFVFILFI